MSPLHPDKCPRLPALVEKRLLEFAGHAPMLVRHEGAGCTGSDVYCHAVVRDAVARGGGRQIFGWLQTVPVPSRLPQGAYGFTFHSVWFSPDKRLIDLAPHAFSREGWSVFIPDATRRYDFVNERGYNALVIYTDAQLSTRAGQLSGMPVRPRVLYWSSHLYLLPIDTYEGRFRRASKHIQEIEARYALRHDGRSLVGIERLSRAQRIELAFNYGLA